MFMLVAFITRMAEKQGETVLTEPKQEQSSPSDKKSKKEKKAKKEGKDGHPKEKKDKVDPNQPQKSKAELRAERRAKQVSCGSQSHAALISFVCLLVH